VQPLRPHGRGFDQRGELGSIRRHLVSACRGHRTEPVRSNSRAQCACSVRAPMSSRTSARPAPW
jgi:hypothetical protein